MAWAGCIGRRFSTDAIDRMLTSSQLWRLKTASLVEDCDSAGLALAQLRATYLKSQAAPKYQYYGADDLDFGDAIEEDSDAGIAFVQTSAKLVSSRESSTLVVSADGSVVSGSAAEPTVSSGRTSFTVSADGRMHVEM
ncbi:unnamed protein product [Symbiodinium natans]|uniref:Uncharacterized protein n=1 Tax=Symbiodinium natans TaxID=878477 RepID=A0A812RMH2_9DINO|nr:unnamed protein product [Symbiodinium natans]